MKQILAVAATLSSAFGATPEERANEILVQMNFTEKVAMLHGHKGIYIGNIVGNERLGIPSINMQDGPQGFRCTETTGGTEGGLTTAWFILLHYVLLIVVGHLLFLLPHHGTLNSSINGLMRC